MKIDLLELFSGIGGFTKGLQQAGFDIVKHQFSEVDKHAIANYKYNFKEAEYVGSVVDVRGERSERESIFTFGSPCQDFSLAGKQDGLDGKRSVLIMEAIRIVSEKRPSVFIWENVKGAYSSNAGADFWAIIAAFANIRGYRLEWQLLNTDWFLPQNRERIYLVGHLAGESTGDIFPITETNIRTPKRISDTPTVRTLSAGGNSGGHHSEMTLLRWQNKADGIIEDDTAPTLRASGGTDIRKQPKVLIRSNTKKGYEIANEGDAVNLSVPTSKTRRGRVGKGKSQTLDTQCNQGVVKDVNIRRLTEIECERLQGFTDDWTRYGNYDGTIKEISKTQRYKMCGNAVSVPVVEEIGRRLLKTLNQ